MFFGTCIGSSPKIAHKFCHSVSETYLPTLQLHQSIGENGTYVIAVSDRTNPASDV